MKIQRKRSKPTSAVAAAAASAATAATTDTSAVVDAGATAAAATTDTSADVDTGASAASATVSHPLPQHSAKRRKSKKPLHPTPLVRQFQDDYTGLKLIHPSALRYCLKIVEEELQLTTKSVAQSLLEQNELEESRRVQVWSSQHGRKIVARVREKLRKVHIPARYIRIDDVGLAELSATNKKRVDEIESTRKMLTKLQKQKSILEQEHKEMREARDKWLEKEGKTKKLSDIQLHPLLAQYCVNGTNMVVDESRSLLVKRPDDETKVFSALLDNLPSAYI